MTTAANITTAGRAALLGGLMLSAVWWIGAVASKLRSNMVRFVSILAFACIGMRAAAADFDRCDGMGGEMTVTYERDLGNGYIVSNVHTWSIGVCFLDEKTGKSKCEPSGSWDSLIVESCASGQYISSPTFSCSSSSNGSSSRCDKEGFLDVRAEATAILDEAAPSQTITFEDLAAMLKAVSPETSINQPEQPVAESCLCHLAYPTLRGKKERYLLPTVYIDGELQ